MEADVAHVNYTKGKENLLMTHLQLLRRGLLAK